MPSGSIFAAAFLFLAILVARLRVQPSHPATVAEIEADGGRWVKTNDGRLIEYFTCGKAGGTWVYVQVGYGATGQAVVHWEICLAAEKLGLQVFSPSQPGFGLSSSYPLDKVRTLKEWPADIQLIMDKENIQEMYVSGVSAGCVHAFTVAHHLHDRVLGVGVNTPSAPLSIETALNPGLAIATRFVRFVFEYPYAGDALGWLMSKVSAYDRMSAAPDVKAALDKMSRLASEGSTHWASVLKGFTDDQDRGMRKGFRGWTDNMAVQNQDPPFDVKELGKMTAKGAKFIISTSPDDTTNPPVMQKWWVDQIPGAELMHCEEGWGHMHGVAEGFWLELFGRMIGSKQ